MRNNAPGGFGNDLAIDNIALRPCGPTLAIPNLLNFCAGNAVSIPVEIVNSPYLNPVFQWQIFQNGQWEDIPNSNNDTLTWSNPSEGDLIRVLVANANNNLSISTCRIISETALLKQLPNPVISLQTQDISCFGGSDGQLTVNITQGMAPFAYLWSNGETTDTLSNISPGIYSLTIKDAIGCVGTSSATLNAPSPLLSNLTGSNVSCFGGDNATASVVVSGGTVPYTYKWSNSETNSMLSNLSAEVYTVTVTDGKGCTDAKTVTITEPDLLTIQTDSMLVTCFGGNDATATSMVSGGTIPYTYLWSNALSTASISNLSAGVYLLTVTDGNGCTQTNAVNITEPPLLALSLSASNISCYPRQRGA